MASRRRERHRQGERGDRHRKAERGRERQRKTAPERHPQQTYKQ